MDPWWPDPKAEIEPLSNLLFRQRDWPILKTSAIYGKNAAYESIREFPFSIPGLGPDGS
jgi:hypothetical protein